MSVQDELAPIIAFVDVRVFETVDRLESALALDVYGTKTFLKKEIAYYRRLRRAVHNHGDEGDGRTVRFVAGLWIDHADFQQEWAM